MDYLQYLSNCQLRSLKELQVLNLVINGLPSILGNEFDVLFVNEESFKPCYKWITFNTIVSISFVVSAVVF